MLTSDDLTKLHPADIEALLKKRGKSFADVGRNKKLPRQVVSAVVHHHTTVFEGVAEMLLLPEVGALN